MRTLRTQRHCPGSPAQTAASTSPPPPARSKKAEGKRQARRRRQRRRWRAGGKRYLGPAPVLVGEGEGGERADAPDAGDGPAWFCVVLARFLQHQRLKSTAPPSARNDFI
jgi:hypothetical protein